MYLNHKFLQFVQTSSSVFACNKTFEQPLLDANTDHHLQNWYVQFAMQLIKIHTTGSGKKFEKI